MSTVEEHDAIQDAMTRRWEAAKALLLVNLEKVAKEEGVTFYEGTDGTHTDFALDFDNGTSVDFEGFHGAPTFVVEMLDGTRETVQYDVSQMRFDSDLDVYEAIAADPLTWCHDSIEIVEDRAEAA